MTPPAPGRVNLGYNCDYIATVMDDFSRFILAWKLQLAMTAESLIDVVQEAVDLTAMTDVPVEHRTVLLSDNGPGYLSNQFSQYLRLVGIGHITASQSRRRLVSYPMRCPANWKERSGHLSSTTTIGVIMKV